MKHLKFLLFALLSAVLTAFFEVQIKTRFGYENIFWVLILVLLHTTFINRSWNIKKELGVLSFFILSLFLEGIFWYVLNPVLGIEKLIPNPGLWKSAPWLLLPYEYWIKFGTGLVFYIISNLRSD